MFQSGGGAALGRHSARWETFWCIRAQLAQKWPDGWGPDQGYWNHVVNETEVKKLADRTKASEPSPSDGTMYPDTWVTLSWVPGAYAVSHDVYLGDNVDDIRLYR